MIPFYRPYLDKTELLAAIRPGPARDTFESTLAARVKARYAVAFAYGRSAIFAALKALSISQAAVIVPAYTCAIVAEAVLKTNNRPLFVDIDLADYNMSLRALKAALTPQTQAVIATHLYGYPTDVNQIRNILGTDQIPVIEDSASGLLTFSPGTAALQGDIGIYSFGPAKPLYTVQGGVAVTNSADLYQKLKAYREKEMGQLPGVIIAKRWANLLASYLVFNEPVYGLLHKAGVVGSQKQTGATEYETSPESMPADYATGYADFQARIGLVQLDKLDTILANRKALTNLYTRELSNITPLTPAPVVAGATYSYYTIRVKKRDAIGFSRQMLRKKIAVDTAYDYTLPALKPYLSFAKGSYPCAQQAAHQVVNLPNYPGLSQNKASYIAESVRQVLRDQNAG